MEQTMGAIDPHDSRQDQHAAACRLVGKMAVLTLCGCCNRPVVGVVMHGKPGRYSIECKACGYSATSSYAQSD
jgi:hypothetical protein